jgi:hypothetical protein
MKLAEIVKPTDSPWYSAYWFARMLINKDKYVPIEKEPELLLKITASLKVIASENRDKEYLELQKQQLKNMIENRYGKTESNKQKIINLLNDLNKEIISQDYMNVFILTCENILIPLQQSIKNIPSDDREFTESIAKTYLDVEGMHGLADVITLWDDLGVKGCLNAERTEIVRAFATLRVLLSNDKLTENEKDIVLTAFVQEFERRSAQKRNKEQAAVLKMLLSLFLIITK